MGAKCEGLKEGERAGRGRDQGGGNEPGQRKEIDDELRWGRVRAHRVPAPMTALQEEMRELHRRDAVVVVRERQRDDEPPWNASSFGLAIEYCSHEVAVLQFGFWWWATPVWASRL